MALRKLSSEYHMFDSIAQKCKLDPSWKYTKYCQVSHGSMINLTLPSASSYRQPINVPSSEDTSTSILKLFESLKIDDEKEKEEEQPDAKRVIIEERIKLLPYQVEGISWMIRRENVEKKNTGGILADDMGLGKTVQILNLIATHLSKDSKKKATLVVCPLSTLGHWKGEIISKLPSNIKLTEYYGKSREGASTLKKFDIVLTTYGTLSAEMPNEEKGKKGGELFDVDWFRIVLDEAHTIKNPSANVSKATCAISSVYRWAITGTPVQNSANDLYSLLLYVKGSECPDKKWWNAYIAKGCQSNHSSTRTVAFQRLQAILKPILLRRTKDLKVDGKPILELPPISSSVKKVSFSDKEKHLYDKVFAKAKRMFKAYLQNTDSYMNILDILLKMRQTCDHSYMVIYSAFQREFNSFADLNAKFEYITSGADDDDSDSNTNTQVTLCSSCDEEIDQAYIASGGCSHQFCELCLEDVDGFDNSKSKFNITCPIKECGSKLTMKQIGETKTKNCLKFYDHPKFEASSKLKLLMEDLKKIKTESEENKDCLKSIVFSQFTSCLDLIEVALEKEGIPCTRLDGTMTHAQRSQAIETFKQDKKINVFLISLKAGGVGLNLTEASRVFLMDPWWNPAIEQQAIDRVYRLGQKRPVQVTRFIVEASVEERIMTLQEKKKSVADAVLSGQAIKNQKLSINDLKLLFS
eukprot:TRINITY_DN7279_c0_g1_i1.p1 TRINITY_DN7279_c0_g1~~TRINITY_DN7279_c0_g1_i1.p1  ORF type:complete len:797 (+),score=283.97 TRINITY_DN7279_c0_g1_i1:307-2391(+)